MPQHRVSFNLPLSSTLPLEYHVYVVCQVPPKLQKLPLVETAIFLKCTAQLVKKWSGNILIWIAIILVETVENIAYRHFRQQFTMNKWSIAVR